MWITQGEPCLEGCVARDRFSGLLAGPPQSWAGVFPLVPMPRQGFPHGSLAGVHSLPSGNGEQRFHWGISWECTVPDF